MGAPIPQDIKRTVAFVYVQSPKGLLPNGTAFFVAVPDTGSSKRMWVYLVTARHVLQGDSGSLLSEVFLRLDKRSGGTETVRVPIIDAGEHRTVFVHDDSTVDLAVIPALPSPDVYDFKTIPINMIVERDALEKRDLREGTEVFFTGLFTPYPGEAKNYPVVRFGRLALVTPERIDWKGTKMDLYLVESASYGGNSGSPVFFRVGMERSNGQIVAGGPNTYLAGVMKGAFQQGSPLQLVETAQVPVAVANIGIAAIVPSYKLLEILNGPDLVNRRTRPK